MQIWHKVLVAILLVATGWFSLAFTPDLSLWQKTAANGSSVGETGVGSAAFSILKRKNAAGSSPLADGYAYVLSGPINLPADWRRVEISGRWWRDPLEGDNHPELALRIHAHYPRLPHGNALFGSREENLIHIGLASRKPHAYFEDTGGEKTPVIRGETATSFPERPREFLLVLDREEGGAISWAFFQSDGQGILRRLFHVARSHLLDGVKPPARIFVKIGAWSAREQPVASRLQLRDLQIRILSWPSSASGHQDEAAPPPSQQGVQPPSVLAMGGADQQPSGPSADQLEEEAEEIESPEQAQTGAECPKGPLVRNVTSGQTYSRLQVALDHARAGDRIELECGVQHGHFVINRRLTLAGAGNSRRAVLDGGESGVVLHILAPGTTVENLIVRRSGTLLRPYVSWRETGIRVEADNVHLKNLLVKESGNGITLVRTKGVRVENCTVRNNDLVGIYLLGASRSIIEGNRVEANDTGIFTYPFYPKTDRILKLEKISPDQGEQYEQAREEFATIMRSKIPAHDNTIRNNIVLDNSSVGIFLSESSHSNTVSGNTVRGSGKGDRDVKAKITKWMFASWDLLRQYVAPGGMLDESLKDTRGTGLLLGGARGTNVSDNRIEDNQGPGIVLTNSNGNRVHHNTVQRNLAGVLILSGARNERVTENRIRNNRAMGVSICDFRHEDLAPRPDGNLVARNDIADNGPAGAGTDAYDSSTERFTMAQLRHLVRNSTLPAQEKAEFLKEPQMLVSLQKEFLKPGHNHWDDGRMGNHYGMFDEAAEGFLDENQDGISEAPFHVPGGSAMDLRPLSAEKIGKILP